MPAIAGSLRRPATSGPERTGGTSLPGDGGPPSPARPRLWCLGCSLANGSLEGLESVETRIGSGTLEALFARDPGLGELAVLRTCHRFELYGWSTEPPGSLAELEPTELPLVRSELLLDEAAVLHLFRVAAGLESTALGEREVRDQVRSAASRVWSRAPRAVLRPLFLAAVEAAEASAPAVPVGRSIAALAADRIAAEGMPPESRILIVGSGTVGRSVAERLAGRGRLTLLYRSRAPEPAFLEATGARAAPWSRLDAEIGESDIVVTAAKTGGRIVGPGPLAGRPRPLLLIDLGLPRNVDPAVRGEPLVRVVDLEGLRRHARLPPLPGLERTVAACAARTAEEVAALGYESWVDAFRRRAEGVRTELLGEAVAALGELTPDERATVDRLTRRLTDRLLEPPTRGLRTIPPGPEGDERRRWAAQLLGIDSSPS